MYSFVNRFKRMDEARSDTNNGIYIRDVKEQTVVRAPIGRVGLLIVGTGLGFLIGFWLMQRPQPAYTWRGRVYLVACFSRFAVRGDERNIKMTVS